MLNVKRKILTPLTAAAVFGAGMATAAGTGLLDTAATVKPCGDTWSRTYSITSTYTEPVIMWDAGGGLPQELVQPRQRVTWSVPGRGVGVIDTLYATAADHSTGTGSTRFEVLRPAHC